MFNKAVKYASGVVIVLLVGSQFVQPEPSNPPVDPSASFDAVANPPKEMAAVVGRSCRDCHSNQTVWPWYSRVAPVSWLLASDVNEGRAKLNFSQWNIYGPEMTRIKMKEMCREAVRAEMPPWYYLPMHRDAKLNGRDVSALCASGI